MHYERHVVICQGSSSQEIGQQTVSYTVSYTFTFHSNIPT